MSLTPKGTDTGSLRPNMIATAQVLVDLSQDYTGALQRWLHLTNYGHAYVKSNLHQQP